MARSAKYILMTAALAGTMLTASAQTSNDGAQMPNDQMARAGNVCAARADLVQRLLSEFKENQQAVGMLHESAILEVFVSDQGTWTILATGTDGRSCVLAAGQDWEIAVNTIGAGA